MVRALGLVEGMCERREVCHDADGQARGQGVSEIEDLLGKVGAGRLSAARIKRERERETYWKGWSWQVVPDHAHGECAGQNVNVNVATSDIKSSRFARCPFLLPVPAPLLYPGQNTPSVLTQTQHTDEPYFV